MSDYGYIFGGSPASSANTDKIERMDVAVKTWSVLAAVLNVAKHGMSAGDVRINSSMRYINILDGYSYPSGGYRKDNHNFDVVAETLTSKTANSGITYGAQYPAMQGVYVGDQHVLLGGRDGGSADARKDQFVYSTVLDTWLTVQNGYDCEWLQTTSNVNVNGISTNKSYIYSGKVSSACNDAGIATHNVKKQSHWTYEIQKISTVQINSAWCRAAMQMGNTSAYITGGRDSSNVSLSDNYLFDYDAETLTAKTGSTKEIGQHALLRDTTASLMFNVTGYRSQESDRIIDVYSYNVSTNTWSSEASTPSQKNSSPGYGHSFMGIDWVYPARPSGTFYALNNYPKVTMYNHGLAAYRQNKFIYTKTGNIIMPTEAAWNQSVSGLSGYSNVNMMVSASLQTIGIPPEYDPSGNYTWYTMLKDGSYHWHLFKTTDKKTFTHIYDFSSYYSHGQVDKYSLDTNGQYLWIMIDTDLSEPEATRGFRVLKFDTASNTIVADYSIDVGVSSPVGTSHFSYCIDKSNSNNHLAVYAYGGITWKQSLDGGLTWSERHDVSTYPVPEDPTKTFAGTGIARYNHVNNRVEMLLGNSSTSERSADLYYYDFINEVFHLLKLEPIVCEYTGLQIKPATDATIDQNTGDWWYFAKYNWCENDVKARYGQFKRNSASSWTSYISGEIAGKEFTGGGDPSISISIDENSWITVTMQQKATTYASRPPGEWTLSLFTNYIGGTLPNMWKSQFSNIDGIETSPTQYGFGGNNSNGVIAYNTVYPYGDPYDIKMPIGNDITIFLSLIEGSTRKPSIGKTVELKDTVTSAVIMSMTEHATYKGLYYGTFTARFSVTFVDVYVDSVKQDKFSPIGLVPSDRYPINRQ